MAGQGGLDADAMWAELKKADSSKIIDASHIPTSVLDGRWVTISTNQNITGQKTFTQQLKSTVATGRAPLIVNSTTLVSNLNSNYLQGYNYLGFIHSNYSASTGGTAYVSGDTHMMLVAEINIDTTYSTYVILLSNEFWGHQHYSALQLHIACTNNDNNGNKSPRCSVHVMSLVGSHTRGVRYKIENNKAYIFIEVYGGNGYGRWASTILQNYDSITTNNANTTGNITLRFAFNQANSGLSDASYVNYISSTGLATSRTLWGQPFNGTANVSGDMTGVGSINMSGNLEIGNGTSPNAILFYGTTGDSPGDYNHTFIAERLWGGTESSELVLFKGNDIGNGNEAVNVSNSGPDRIRHIAAAHLFQTYTSSLVGSVESVCTSSALKSLFGIAANRVTSYVPFMSTVASGTAPFIVASKTVVGNLNADMVDGLHLSDFDGRYVNVTGDTMTGDLTMANTKGFNMVSGTRVVKTSGNWIHGGGDVASSTDANLRFGSWNGIGWYPTISGQTVAQGKNAMWLNVRTGVLDVHSNITSHNGYLAANWDSARRLVLGCGSSYAYIDSRDSSNNVLCNILLHDNKVYIGNYAESNRFVSTVGTGTQPYQCSSITLNTNLNADLLDNWHIADIPRNYNSTATYSLQFALGGEDNGWKKIFACSESGAGSYKSVTVWGRIWYAYGNHAQSEVWNYHFCAIFYMRSGPSSSDSSVGTVENSARLYLPTFAKGLDNIRLVRVGTNNFELQVRQIGSRHNGYIQYQYWANGANASAWRGLQSTSNTSVAVSAGGASTLADSRASSADVWTTARTFYIQDHNASHTGAGVSVNGSANVYLKLPNSIQCNDWFRSTGNSGWYHQNYGGGIYMQDSNFIRNFGNKRLLIQTDTYDTIRLVRTSGSGGSSIAFYNGGGTFRGQLGVNASSWFSFDTGTATANQNVVEISPAGGIHSKAEITAKASGSDIRLKKDIQNYNAMNIINRFRSVKYHWNDIAKANSEVYNNDYDQFGLIAQDLIAGGFEQWVRDVFHDYYTVTYERLIPVVWKGLQEVDDEVTRLKKRVKELEKRLGINN